ncbi:NAD(P)H-hydrate dehydratase [Tsuneonella sp. HG249]
MAEERSLDRAWLGEHPLAEIPVDTDKNERGRVLVIGGSRLSPGGLRLAGEAALRAGAGKVRLATMESLAVPLGLAVPEAGVVALPESADGRLAPNAAERVQRDLAEADCVIIGPGMDDADCAAPFLSAALELMEGGQTLVIDAAAIGAAADCLETIKHARGRCILTPHAGEMARLLDCPKEAVNSDLGGAIRQAVDATGQIIVLKSATTHIADPMGTMLTYGGGGPGLATGGSGDVLAGIAGGLMSCGQDAFTAAAWAVWLHGEAGAKLASEAGAIGYLARELLPLIPMLRRNPV